MLSLETSEQKDHIPNLAAICYYDPKSSLPHFSRARVCSSVFKVTFAPFLGQTVLFSMVNSYHILKASYFGVAYAQRNITENHVRKFLLLASSEEETEALRAGMLHS